MQFLSKAECEVALEQMISLKDQFENVIVNRQRSSCTASARQQNVFASLEEAKSAASDGVGWRDPQDGEVQMAASSVSHQGRVEKLTSCEESQGLAPCKIGDIIIEGEDIFGDGVNIAARLEGLAEPGSVLVSRTVFDHAKGKVTATFEDLG
ncbi:MAG: hypothetical protein IH987_20155, partial [Planctomycetes bacterium]|nr:hypothetical protein [Planctomycetota bacterium]